jgi:hypothetical protein
VQSRFHAPPAKPPEVFMEPTPTRVIHWYDTLTRRVSCGAPGQIGSTKHVHDVTCTRCLANVRTRGVVALDAPVESVLH